LTGNGTREGLGPHADHLIASIDDLPGLLQSLDAAVAPAAAG
jgi:hypothetical protein